MRRKKPSFRNLISKIPKVKFQGILLLGLLLSNIPILPIQAEINDLSRTQRANVQLVIDNINDLLESIEELQQDTRSSTRRAQYEQLQQELNQTNQNIVSKLSDEIKSVPGLDNDSQSRYRHGGHTSSPTAAYCGDGQTQIRKDDGTWENCPQGTILVDESLLDPGNGTPINENTTQGWQAKWELAHVIVHEKYHERFIDQEIQTLHDRRWWNQLPQSEKDRHTQNAIERATTAEMHAAVYRAQKNFLKIYEKALDHEKDDLQDQRRDAQRDRDSDRVSQLEDQIDQLEEKIDWLHDRRSQLERSMRNAVAGSHFGFEDCSWPNDHSTGNVAIAMTFPAGFERFDLQVLENQVVDVRITDTVWYDELEIVDEIINEPTLFMQMPEQVFSGVILQPNVCNYIDEMLSTGQIVASTSPLPIFNTDNLLGEPKPKSQDAVLPSWFKSNAIWWRDGLISDTDIINGIESLIIQNVIPLDSFVSSHPETENQDRVEKGGTFVLIPEKRTIPTYIKDVFGFWADGLVPDSDVANSLGFLIAQGIISSEVLSNLAKDLSSDVSTEDLFLRIQAIYTSHLAMSRFQNQDQNQQALDAFNQVRQNLTEQEFQTFLDYIDNELRAHQDPELRSILGDRPITDLERAIYAMSQFGLANYGPRLFEPSKETLKQSFVVQKWNEAFVNQLLSIKDFESKLFAESSDDVWQQYSEKKEDLDLMNEAIRLQGASQESQNQVSHTLNILKNSRQISHHAQQVLKANGIPVLELEDAITEPSGIIEDIPKINSMDDLEDAYNDAFRTQREAGRQLGHIFDDFAPGDDGIDFLYFGTTDGTVGLVWPESASESSPFDWETISPRISLTYDIFSDGSNPFDRTPGTQTVFTEIESLYGPWFILEIPLNRVSEFDGETFLIPNFVYCRGYDCTPASEYNTPYLDELTQKFEKALTDDLATSLTGFYKKQHNLRTDGLPNLIETINEDLKDGIPNGRNADVDLSGLFPTNVAPLPDPIDDIFSGDLDGYLLIGSDINKDYLPRNYDGDITLDDDFPYLEPPYSESPSDGEMELTIPITVYQFGGKNYPVAQFTLWRWPGECDDAWHNHTPTGHAVNLELTAMSDPDMENCGWGKTSELVPQTVFVSQSIVDAFWSKTGVDPTVNEAMMGGDGFALS